MVAQLAREVIAGVIDKGECEFVSEVASQVPMATICEMLGVPVEDRDTFTEWTADATHGLALRRGNAPPELVERVSKAATALAGYFNELIERRRGDGSVRMGRDHVYRGAHDKATLQQAGKFEVTRDGDELVLADLPEGLDLAGLKRALEELLHPRIREESLSRFEACAGRGDAPLGIWVGTMT